MHSVARTGRIYTSYRACNQEKSSCSPLGSFVSLSTSPHLNTGGRHHIVQSSASYLLGHNTSASIGRSVSTRSLPSSLDAPCAVVSCAVRFYHLSETSDFKDFASIVTPNVKWRRVERLRAVRIGYSSGCSYRSGLYGILSFGANSQGWDSWGAQFRRCHVAHIGRTREHAAPPHYKPSGARPCSMRMIAPYH